MSICAQVGGSGYQEQCCVPNPEGGYVDNITSSIKVYLSRPLFGFPREQNLILGALRTQSNLFPFSLFVPNALITGFNLFLPNPRGGADSPIYLVRKLSLRTLMSREKITVFRTKRNSPELTIFDQAHLHLVVYITVSNISPDCEMYLRIYSLTLNLASISSVALS